MSDNVQFSLPKTAKRNSWIEFLRIISIIGIVICHASYHGGIAENSNGILQYVAVPPESFTTEVNKFLTIYAV